MSDQVTAAQFLLFLAVLLAAALVLRRQHRVTVIYPPDVGLLYRNGQFQRELPPGRYGYFDLFSTSRIVKVSLAETPVTFSEVTVLSKDQFSFRVTLAPMLKVTDARLFLESQGGVGDTTPAHLLMTVRSHAALHALLPAAAIEAAAAMTLSEILAGREALRAGIHARISEAVPGAIIETLLVTSINLPPETRKMFTDVERARVEAQASLERARGEQASLRVLANAARMLTDNPSLGNLRLLQVIESSKGQATIVIGDGSAAGLVPAGRAESKPAASA